MCYIDVVDRQLNPREINHRCTITLLSTNTVKKQFSTRPVIDFFPLFEIVSINRLENDRQPHTIHCDRYDV